MAWSRTERPHPTGSSDGPRTFNRSSSSWLSGARCRGEDEHGLGLVGVRQVLAEQVEACGLRVDDPFGVAPAPAGLLPPQPCEQAGAQQARHDTGGPRPGPFPGGRGPQQGNVHTAVEDVVGGEVPLAGGRISEPAVGGAAGVPGVVGLFAEQGDGGRHLQQDLAEGAHDLCRGVLQPVQDARGSRVDVLASRVPVRCPRSGNRGSRSSGMRRSPRAMAAAIWPPGGWSR